MRAILHFLYQTKTQREEHMFYVNHCMVRKILPAFANVLSRVGCSPAINHENAKILEEISAKTKPSLNFHVRCSTVKAIFLALLHHSHNLLLKEVVYIL